jgi:outer membrane protein assembly factor BamD (BamD/ComL family)
MIHPKLAYTLALPLIFLGTNATKTRAQSPSGVVAEDAVNKLQDPLGGPTQPAPTLKPDGQFQSAPTLFRQGKFAEAERQFAWIAQVRKGTTWGERSQYYLAECQYLQKKYVEALESLERLHFDYPATDYCDQLIRREYEIAQRWITWTKPAVLTRKKPLLHRDVGEGPPIFNTDKLTLRALAAVRQNNPSGPLADDAAIQIADYHMANADYDAAAAHYDQFIAEYRKSRYCPRARLAAIEARLRIYLLRHRDAPAMRLARELSKPLLRAFLKFNDNAGGH